MTSHDTLNLRIKDPRDEFYTLYTNVNEELSLYKSYLDSKTIVCPCDSLKSNWVKWFLKHFDELHLKKLAWASVSEPKLYVYEGGKKIRIESIETSDATSGYMRRIMAEYDVIVTNPPFSCFKEFMTNVLLTGSDYIILGTLMKCVNLQLMCNELVNGRLHIGGIRDKGVVFEVPENYKNEKGVYRDKGRYYKSLGMITILTSFKVMDAPRLELGDNGGCTEEFINGYGDVIIVDSVKNLPDTDKVIAVPISFLSIWCEDQFDILGSYAPPGKFERLMIRKARV